jgi:hypothetical protein
LDARPRCARHWYSPPGGSTDNPVGSLQFYGQFAVSSNAYLVRCGSKFHVHLSGAYGSYYAASDEAIVWGPTPVGISWVLHGLYLPSERAFTIADSYDRTIAGMANRTFYLQDAVWLPGLYAATLTACTPPPTTILTSQRPALGPKRLHMSIPGSWRGLSWRVSGGTFERAGR